MKKILVLICLSIMLCGCGKVKKEDIVKDLKSTVNGVKSYKLTGNMEISNDEETFTYSLESNYLKGDYYKVRLVNQTNNHEQIILKTDGDVYVITPSLNKSFKFQSDWPKNSSQSYLLGNLVSDIEGDKDLEFSENDNGYVIKTKVNYPNNAELKYQKIYLNKKKLPEKVEVYNENDIVKIKVTFTSIDLKAGLKKDNFKLEEYVKDTEINDTTLNKPNQNDNNENKPTDNNSNNSENKPADNNTNTTCTEEDTTCQNKENNGSATNTDATQNTGTIENIIYPLYIPSNTYLTSSEKLSTARGTRVILTFSGEKNFVLIEEPTVKETEMEIIPVYGEPFLLSESIGALSANSLSWDVNNISYYLASTELNANEMQSIANSLGNTKLVANTK